MLQAIFDCTISIAVKKKIISTPENTVVKLGVERCLCRGLSRVR